MISGVVRQARRPAVLLLVPLLVGGCLTTAAAPTPSGPADPAAASAGASLGASPPAPAASGLPSSPPPPAPSPDPVIASFPVPEGSALVNARATSDAPDAYRLAAWDSPLAPDAVVAFYAALASGRWLPSGQAPTTTPLGTDLALADAEGTYDQVALTIGGSGSGSRISVRFVPPGELPASSPEVEASGEITFATLPPATLAPGSLPAWAIPDGATVLDSATIGPTVYAELSLAAGPAALLESYGRALDDAGLAHSVRSDSGSIVITITDEAHPGTIVLTPDPPGSHVALALTP